jgi:hypothetical protein
VLSCAGSALSCTLLHRALRWRGGFGGIRWFSREVKAPALRGRHQTRQSAGRPLARCDRSWYPGESGRSGRRIVDSTVRVAWRQAPAAPAGSARNRFGVSDLRTLTISAYARRSITPKRAKPGFSERHSVSNSALDVSHRGMTLRSAFAAALGVSRTPARSSSAAPAGALDDPDQFRQQSLPLAEMDHVADTHVVGWDARTDVILIHELEVRVAVVVEGFQRISCISGALGLR